MAGDAVDSALTTGDYSAEQFRAYGDRLCAFIEAMRKLVYAFYDQEFSFRSFIKRYPGLRGDLTDCLIGNLTRDFQPLFAGLAEFADLPQPLAHGRPLVLS